MTYHAPLNVDTVKSQLLSRLPDVLTYLYPAGKIHGSEFEIGDVHGQEGKSMKVALRGEKAGLWTDNATDDQGDILTLWAVTHNLCIKTQFIDVLKSAAEWLGISPTNQELTQQKMLPQKYQQSPLQTKPQMQEPQTTQYLYHAVDGSVIAYVNRHETDKGKGKDFRCFDVINQSHKSPDPRPLYNWPNVAQSEHIILCEGEKCADALISVGYCATTAMFGSNTSIPKTDWSPLAGKNIIMWPDHDDAGYRYAERICEHLKTICASVTQLDPPTDKPPKWDAADAVFEGINIDEYIKDHTPHKEPVTPPFQPIEVHNFGAYYRDNSPMPEDIIEPRILTPGGLLVFGGAPKVGKSDFVLSWLIHMALGREFLGFTSKRPLKVFYFQAEIKYHYLRERIKKFDLNDDELKIIEKNFFATSSVNLTLNPEGVQQTANAIKQCFPDGDLDILCVDPLYSVFYGGESNGTENDNDAMFHFLQHGLCHLRDLINPDAGIILTHHTRKISKKDLKEEPFQALSGGSVLRRYYTTGMLLYYPDETPSNRKLIMELRNGSGLPTKTINRFKDGWKEIDSESERLVNKDYGAKLDAERMRKKEVILNTIFNKAAEGSVYTITQFCELFEGKAGLGGKDAIKTRIDTLCTKGYIEPI